METKEREELKIFQVTDCDWVIAHNAKEAIDVFCNVTALDWYEDDWEKEGYPIQMTKEDAENTTFILDIDEDRHDPQNQTTFQKAFEKHVAEGGGPDMFATSEI